MVVSPRADGAGILGAADRDAGQSFDVAWINVRPAWLKLSTEQRRRVLAVVGENELKTVAKDIGSPAFKLPAESVASLLSGLAPAIGEASSDMIQVAASSHLSPDERNSVSKLLFETLRNDPDGINRVSDLRAASSLASEANQDGFEFYCFLLKSDPGARRTAFANIDAFLSGKSLTEDQANQIGTILAEALKTDANDLVVCNFEIANHNGLAKLTPYAQALKGKMDSLKASRESDDKSTLQRLKDIKRGH